MPKRSADVLDYLLEPAELTDVAPERSMLYANILREIFLEAARTARDNPHAAAAPQGAGTARPKF